MRAQLQQPCRGTLIQSRLCLLGDVRIDVGGWTPRIPESSKPLLVLLALHSRQVERRWAAGVLWPDGNDERAAGNLRSAIWRLRGAGLDILETTKVSVRLADHVSVDVDSVDEWAGSITAGTTGDSDLRVHPECLEALDLLPGWYENDYVIMARERLRHRVLHALEALSRALSQRSRHDEAVDAALLAARLEPFRDSAQRVLIAAHLAEGNWIEAQRSCRLYVDLLQSELGIDAPADLRDFMCRPWDFVAAPGGGSPQQRSDPGATAVRNGHRDARVTT